jgi:hypothetical protein
MVRDRSKLEQLCCECYGVVKRETDRLLPDPPGLLRSANSDERPTSRMDS